MKRTMTAASCIAIAALGLSACGKKTGTAATGETTTATATASAPTPAAPMTPPTRKPGYWEQKIATAGMTQTIKMCIDQAVEQKMKWWGSQAPGKADCAEQTITPHLGGGWDFHSVCKMGESGTITSNGSATGDFSSHYKVEMHSQTSGSPMAQANGPHTTTIEATWTGPCPAGVKGGDMEMPGGMKINMLDAMNGTAGLGHGPGGRPTPAEMAKLRAQAMEMAKAQQHRSQ
jgi:hypothetical protein